MSSFNSFNKLLKNVINRVQNYEGFFMYEPAKITLPGEKHKQNLDLR